MKTISVTKHAWDIRRNVAKRSNKPIMQVSWKTCYRMAYNMAHPKVRHMPSTALESHFYPTSKPGKGIIRKALAVLANFI